MSSGVVIYKKFAACDLMKSWCNLKSNLRIPTFCGQKAVSYNWSFFENEALTTNLFRRFCSPGISFTVTLSFSNPGCCLIYSSTFCSVVLVWIRYRYIHTFFSAPLKSSFTSAVPNLFLGGFRFRLYFCTCFQSSFSMLMMFSVVVSVFCSSRANLNLSVVIAGFGSVLVYCLCSSSCCILSFPVVPLYSEEMSTIRWAVCSVKSFDL